MLVAPMTKQGVLVRAPYFGLNQDLVIGADHRVAVTSDLAEYLFGAETVLVPAWAIKDNRRATHWELAPKAKLFQLQLDRATGVMVGNCRLEGTAMCRSAIGKVLNDDEARCFAAEHKMGYQN